MDKNQNDKLTLNEVEKLISDGKIVMLKQKAEEHFPVTYISSNVENVLGFPSSYFIENNNEWKSRVHPLDLPDLRKAFNAALDNSSSNIEFRFNVKGTGYSWLKGRIIRINDDNGQPQSIVSYFWVVGKDLDLSKPQDDKIRPYEYVIARCSHLLLNNEIGAVNKTLSILRQFADADRAYIFENHTGPEGELCASQKFEACGPDITPQIENPELQALPYSVLPWWKKELTNNRIINEITKNMPAAERELMENQNIKSVLVIPIHVGGEWHGFIGFDDAKHAQHWSPGEVQLLQMAAQIYGSYKHWVNAREELEDSLREKNILIQEVHHRVKNNLAIVSGLLQLQIYNFQDPSLQEALQESQSRIHSMALIHEKLYQSENLTSIPFRSYLENLAESLHQRFNGDRKQINVHFSADDITLNINEAIPLGLLLNEIISNSYQHAFPDQKSGDIYLNVERENTWLNAEIRDNGVGADVNKLQQSNGLGMTLINALVEQLEATHTIEKSEGLHHSIKFQLGVLNSGSGTLL